MGRLTDRLMLALAHAVAVTACFLAGWFVHTQASPWMPMMDEWKLLADRLSAPSVAGWCFEYHNQHRYPLGKAIWVVTTALDGGGFRLAQFTTIGLLTAASVLFIWTARGLRGRAHVADALFPILLLHFGHAFNLLMGYQLTFALAAYGLAGWLWAANRLAVGGGVVWAILAGGYGSVVAQTGGFGFLFTPALVGWAVLVGWRRTGGARIVLLASAALWGGYGLWIARTMPSAPPEVESVGQFIAAAVGNLAIGWGTWQPGAQVTPRVIGGALALAVLTGAAVVALRMPPGPVRLAVLAVLAGGGLVAAGTAYARGHGLAGRFVTPGAGLLAVAWLAVAARPAAGWLTGIAAVTLGGFVYWQNIDPGLREGYEARCIAFEMKADIAAGVPPVFLSGRYGGSLPALAGDGLRDHLTVYRRHGVPAFAGLAPDPAFRAVSATGVAVPFEFHCPYEDLETNPRTVPFPDPPSRVIGLRLRVLGQAPVGWHRVRLDWTDGGERRSEVAYPPWVPIGPIYLAFPLTGTPTGVRLVADSTVPPFTVEAVEWMVRE